MIVALLRHQAENVLGKDAIGIAGDTLLDIGGEKVQGTIDAILNTNEGTQKLINAALHADSYFKEKCTDQDLRDAFTIPTGDLPSVQIMLKELPNALDQDGALKMLSETLGGAFPNLKHEQIQYGASLYLDSLNRALLRLQDFALPIIGQTVLDSKMEIKELKVKVDEALRVLSPAPVPAIEIVQPLPEFDHAMIENMDAPGGTLRVSDPFYVERDVDKRIHKQLIKNGSTVIIRASHQTGKSSLLARGLNRIGPNVNIIRIDLQAFEREVLESENSFYKHFARTIIKKLKLDTSALDSIWKEDISPLTKLTELMQDYILAEITHQIILAVDEADKLILTSYRENFFGLLRVWHNNRAYGDPWNRLNLVLVISTEPSALISSMDQSPFNVGDDVFLDDFNYQQVYWLNKVHGEPIQGNDFEAFFELLNGHPYLTRKGLYLLISQQWKFQDLIKNASEDDGPFSDHIRSQFRILFDDYQLRKSFDEIIEQRYSEDKTNLSRLLQSGLIKGRGETFHCRCKMYSNYFASRFR